MSRNRSLEEIQEDIRTLTRVPSEFIHAKLDELAEEIGELAKPKWIPVSERLPKKPDIDGDSDCYIVQTRRVAQPFIGYWDGREWTDEEVDILDEVIAWMPLPEPYKQNDEGAEK